LQILLQKDRGYIKHCYIYVKESAVLLHTDYFIGKYYDCIVDQTIDFSSASLRQVVFRNHCPMHEVVLAVRIVRYTGKKCEENSGVRLMYNLR